MFAIDIDPQQSYVRFRFGGLLTTAEAKDYVAKVGAAFVAKIGRRPYVMLIDASDAKLQTQEVIGVFAEQIAHFPDATRIALVVGASPARMQLRRLLSRDYSRFFDTVAEAEAWLLDGWPPAPRAV